MFRTAVYSSRSPLRRSARTPSPRRPGRDAGIFGKLRARVEGEDLPAGEVEHDDGASRVRVVAVVLGCYHTRRLEAERSVERECAIEVGNGQRLPQSSFPHPRSKNRVQRARCRRTRTARQIWPSKPPSARRLGGPYAMHCHRAAYIVRAACMTWRSLATSQRLRRRLVPMYR